MTSKPARVVRTSKSVMMISVNPSDSLGSRYLEAKPVKAIRGRIVRFSGLVCVVYQHREFLYFVTISFEAFSAISSCLIGGSITAEQKRSDSRVHALLVEC
jgi:hypothetical protein